MLTRIIFFTIYHAVAASGEPASRSLSCKPLIPLRLERSNAHQRLSSPIAGVFAASGECPTAVNPPYLRCLSYFPSLPWDTCASTPSAVKSIEDLSTIFKELAVLVIDQGTILDRIDFNMEQVRRDWFWLVGWLVGETETDRIGFLCAGWRAADRV